LDAASDSDEKKLKTELNKAEDVTTKKKMLMFKDSDMNTALHFAAKNGNALMVKFIID